MAGGVKRSGESVDVRNVARGGDKGLMGRVYIDKDGGAGQPEPDLGHFVRASTAVRSPCDGGVMEGSPARKQYVSAM